MPYASCAFFCPLAIRHSFIRHWRTRLARLTGLPDPLTGLRCLPMRACAPHRPAHARRCRAFGSNAVREARIL